MAKEDKQSSQEAEEETSAVTTEDEQYTEEETEMAEEAANEALEETDASVTEEQSGDEVSTDESTTEETKTYSNGIAQCLGWFSNILKKFSFTSTIGKWMETLADTVDNFYSDSSDDSLDVSDIQGVREAMESVDSQDMVESLEAAASEISETDALNPQDGTVAGELAQAVKQSAQTDPKDTASAIQLFNNTAEDAIGNMYQEGSEDYNQAIENLGTINQSLTTSFYEALLDGEHSGEHMVLEDNVEYIDKLDLTGVKLTYSEFIYGADVSEPSDPDSGVKEKHQEIVAEGFAKSQCLQNEDDPDALRSSNGLGSYVAKTAGSEKANVVGDTFDTSVMYNIGINDIDASVNEKSDYSNTIVASDSMSSMASGALVDEGLAQIHSAHDTSMDLNEIYHDSYAEMINGLTAYNDAAANEIENRYGSDSEGKQQATDALAETMRTNVEKLFSSLKADDEALGFLTDEDKEQLDSLKLTGVNVKFKDYQDGMNLKTGKIETYDVENTGEMSEAEEEIYKNASPADAERWANDTQIIDDSAMFTNEDYGQKTARELSGQDEGTKTLEDNLAKAEAEAQAEQATENSY